MAKILHIDTSTEICSVCISDQGKPLTIRETAEDKSHATRLAVFVQECLEELKISLPELQAVAVSKGPGSYTGLRIGVSFAKGICYAAGIPLITVPTLQSMALQMRTLLIAQGQADFHPTLCPMIDARRMEVYAALYNLDLQEIRTTEAQIIDELSFGNELSQGHVLFFGNGAAKCKAVLQHPHAHFSDEFQLSSIGMIPLAEIDYHAGKFEDPAYFEPYYLKDFIATIPKNKFF